MLICMLIKNKGVPQNAARPLHFLSGRHFYHAIFFPFTIYIPFGYFL